MSREAFVVQARRVLAFDPMSLESDLKPLLDAFLKEDGAERKRRLAFDAAWTAQADVNGHLNALLRKAAGLLAGYFAFANSRLAPLQNNALTLHACFKGDGETVVHSLTFEPDAQRRHIDCKSTLGSESQIDVEKLDELAEVTVSNFVKAFIALLRGEDASPLSW